MRKLLLFCTICCLAFVLKVKAANCKAQFHSVPESFQESFSLAFTLPNDVNSTEENSIQQKTTLLSFYKWYLQHEDKINAIVNKEGKEKDLLPPFHINFLSLQQYIDYIRKNFPCIVDEATSAIKLNAPAAV